MQEVNNYRGYIESIARSAYTSSSVVEFEDLCQIGEMAVIRGLKTFDSSKNVPQDFFIKKLIKQDIYKEASRFMGIFTVPTKVSREINLIKNLDLELDLFVEDDLIFDIKLTYIEMLILNDHLLNKKKINKISKDTGFSTKELYIAQRSLKNKIKKEFGA